MADVAFSSGASAFGRGTPSTIDRRALASTVSPNEDNSTFGNVLRFLGRPGFAARAALMGDFESAGRNLAQMAIDFPTGGFIDRRLGLTSLANVFIPEKYEFSEELAPLKRQIETTDVLDEWGVLSKRNLGTFEKAAIDIAGGILTDPLTYLSGSGLVRGLGKGLKGADRVVAQADVVSALRKTRQGSTLLDDTVRNMETEFLAKFAPGSEVRPGVARTRTLDSLEGLSRDRRLLIERGFERRAAEKIFLNEVRGQVPDLLPRTLQEITNDRWLDEGTKALESLGHIPTKGGLYLNVPFMEKSLLAEGFGSKAFAVSAPGLAMRRMDKTMPGTAEAIRESARGLYAATRGAFFGRHLTETDPSVTKGLRDAAHTYSLEVEGARRKTQSLVREIAAPWTPDPATGRLAQPLMDEITSMTKAWDEGQEAVRLAFADAPVGIKALKENLARFRPKNRPKGAFREWARARGIADEAEQVLDGTLEFRKFQDDFLQAEAARDTSLLHHELFDRKVMQERVWENTLAKAKEGVAPERHAAVEHALNTMKENMNKIPDELRRSEGPWKADSVFFNDLLQDTNTVYMPRQISGLYDALLGEGMRKQDVRKAFQTALSPTDPSTKLRKHLSPEDFETALKEIAEKHLDPEVLTGLAERYQNLNVFELFNQRMGNHAQTMAAGKLAQKFKRAGLVEADQTILGRYLQHQFKGLADRDGFTKIFGGGKIRIEANETGAFGKWAKEFEDAFVKDDGSAAVYKLRRRNVKVDGKNYVEIQWPGLNKLFKPMLTSAPTNPSFHVRNTIGAAFMGLFNPDVGAKGFTQIFGAMRNSGIVRKLSGWGFDERQVTRFMRALDDIPESAALRKSLMDDGVKIGKYSSDEVLDAIRMSVGPQVAGRPGANATDLMGQITDVDFLGREVFRSNEALKELGAAGPRRAQEFFRKFIKLGTDMGDAVETRFRANSIMSLMAAGKTPQQAVKQTERAFVGYNINSEIERGLRDIIPFFKFASHSAVWSKELATGPTAGLRALRSGMGATRRSGQDQQEAGILPDRIGSSLALPLPWKNAAGNQEFLLGLGLPLESTLQILGTLTPQGFRQNVLGGLNPPVKVVAEGITNRSFYFGGEWAAYRRAPAWLPRWATKEIPLPNGKKVYEIDGALNEVLNAMPTSRLDSTLDKLVGSYVRGEKSKVLTAMQTFTGVRAMSADTERELQAALKRYLHDKVRSGEIGETVNYFSRIDKAAMPEDLKIVLAGLKSIKAEKRKQRREQKKIQTRGGAFQ